MFIDFELSHAIGSVRRSGIQLDCYHSKSDRSFERSRREFAPGVYKHLTPPG